VSRDKFNASGGERDVSEVEPSVSKAEAAESNVSKDKLDASGVKPDVSRAESDVSILEG